jgi:hypothetical protein
MSQKANHPILLDAIETTLDVQINHPVDGLFG